MRPSFLCWIARHKLATIYYCSNCVVVCVGCAAEGLRAKYPQKKTDLNVAYIFLFRKRVSRELYKEGPKRIAPLPLCFVLPREKKRFEDFFSFLVSYFAGGKGNPRGSKISSVICYAIPESQILVYTCLPCCMCALRYLLFRSPSSSPSSVLDFARGSIPPPARAFPNAHGKEK